MVANSDALGGEGLLAFFHIPNFRLGVPHASGFSIQGRMVSGGRTDRRRLAGVGEPNAPRRQRIRIGRGGGKRMIGAARPVGPVLI